MNPFYLLIYCRCTYCQPAHTVRNEFCNAYFLPLRTVQTYPYIAAGCTTHGYFESVYGLFAKKDGDVTGENIQARIRGLLLSAASNRSGALVLNTGNKSEAAMGYFTLYGDSTGALAVIGDLYKTEVYALAALVNDRAGRKLIPQNIFDKAPSAELAPNQKDEDSLPPYNELDEALRKVFDGTADDAASRQARARLFKNEFKRRQCPPALIVSDSPLAACRRPVAGRMDL